MDVDFNIRIFSFNRRILISKQWLQFGIMILTLMATMVAAYWGTVTVLIVLLAVVGSAGIILTLLRYFNIGYLLLFLGAMFVPFKGFGGLNASVLIIGFILVLWIVEMFVVKRRFDFVHSRALRPAIYFMVVSVVAFGMGQVPWFVFSSQAPLDTQLGGFAIYFFSVATMVMTANVMKDIRWLRVVVWTYIGLSTIYIFGRMINLPFIDLVYQRGVTANSMFWTWLVALALSQAIFNNDLKPRMRVLLYLIVAVTLYVAVVLNFDWKSGWVPAVISATVLIALRFKKLAVVALPFAIWLGIYLAQDLITTDQYSWSTRVEAWVIVLDIARTSPVLGMGFANYYWYTKLFAIRGYYVKFNSHSQFVDLIAQTGFIGLVIFLWIFFEMFYLAWNLTRQLKDGFARGYAYGVLAGLAGTLMAAFLVDWVLPFVYNIGLDGFRASIYPWIFFGGLIAIEQMVLEKKIL